MFINELATPAILLDTDTLKRNIDRYQAAADKAGKQLWPMTKTHKSTRIAAMQLEAGAAGFLCGTLDECETLIELKKPVMYAYPPAGARSLERVINLAKRGEIVLRLDTVEAAKTVDHAARLKEINIKYTAIVDSGLHRFGLSPDSVGAFVAEVTEKCPNLIFMGISTHPGHVYEAANAAAVPAYSTDERETAEKAVASLKKAGFIPEFITSGSTPTYFDACENSAYNVLHPGNYVYHDAIQLSNGSAKPEDCALSVLATVISRPTEDRLIIDAGAKCLGLDMGAHGCASVKGYGVVIGHPELTIYSLSEEVGKMHIEGTTDLKIGDKVRIIPNHSCSTANNTSLYMCVSGDEVTGEIPVDIRGNSKTRL